MFGEFQSYAKVQIELNPHRFLDQVPAECDYDTFTQFDPYYIMASLPMLSPICLNAGSSGIANEATQRFAVDCLLNAVFGTGLIGTKLE
jgi:hypothetical protein